MTKLRLGRTSCVVLAALGCVAAASSARADEPKKATEPRILNEPGEVTQVVDAFDEDDPFDLNITLGYQHTWKNAVIRRETALDQPGLSSGGYKADTMNVAKYSESTSRLNTRIDAGLYKDIGLYLRLPIILSNSRELSGLDGSDRVQSVVLQGAMDPTTNTTEQLFSLPFSSPNRSGIEYLALGLDANIFNQARDHSKPTWLVGLEGRFNVSEPMHACNDKPAAGQVKCADPSDINRNGVGGEGDYEGNPASPRKPGVSRGTTGLELHTFISRREKYVEPYGGFRALFEFQTASSDFGQSDLKGSLVNHPPLEGQVIIGLMVIPWENREQFQRVTIDGRVTGSYRSEGRDYSELFDALGSSAAASMRRPNFAEFHSNPDPATAAASPSVVNQGSQKVYFTGLTDVQAHGKFGLSGMVTWQAGEFVKFQLGLGYTHVQSHFITMDQPCNPDFKGDAGRSGPCRVRSTGSVTGIPNPNYRPQINHVGSRFKVDDVNLVDLWINGIVMF